LLFCQITYLKDQWGHIGSFFGYSLATADLDGNGMLDIIVGAPYFTGRKGEEKLTDQDEQVLLKSTKSNRVRDTLIESIPSHTDSHSTDEQPNLDVKWGPLAPDIGRVYVFYGYPSSNVTNSHLLNRDRVRPDYLSRPPIVLSGLKMVGGRFGHSLVNLGDVDGDGTEDLAISCPYCSDADRGHDKGAVLIYLGRENAVLENSPFQVTQILCDLGDPLGNTGSDLRPFVFHLNTAGAFRELDLPLHDQPESTGSGNLSNPQMTEISDSVPQSVALKRFKREPLGLQTQSGQKSAHRDSVTISAEVISGNEDEDLRDNVASITYNLQLTAKIEIVLMRARNTLWFDSPEWDLPMTRTLPWSGPNETPCGSECRFHVRLSVAVHGNPALLRQHHHRQPQHAQSFKLHVIIDLDASMENLVFKRLSGRELTNSSHSGLPVNGVMHTVVPVTLTSNELGETDRLTLLSLALEPQSARVRSFLWKPILINASLLPVSGTMPNLSGSKSVASWMLHPFLGKRYFLSRPLQFANPACGPDNICRADLRVRMMDISDGPTNNLVVYFRERITQRNLTVGIGNLGENAYAAQLRMTIPHQFSFTLPDDLSCQSRLLPTIQVISAEGHVRGVCLTPAWALNPLRLNAVQRGHLDLSPDTTRRVDGTEDDKNWQKRVKRLKRSVTGRSQAKIANGAHKDPESENDMSKRTAAVRATRSILPGIRKRQQEIVKCGQELANLGMPICAAVQCRIDQLSRGDAVRIVLRGYVWADTFFRHKISDLAIVSEAKSELPTTAFGIPVHGNRTIQPLAISQNFVFHGIQIPLFREIPLWPIILGGVLGAVLLTLIIIGMWKCGFFRRRRWYENAAPNTVSMIPTNL
ncbi:hypothetical protein AHF37_03720, partial [Paragonimus kellicotti]